MDQRTKELIIALCTAIDGDDYGAVRAAQSALDDVIVDLGLERQPDCVFTDADGWHVSLRACRPLGGYKAARHSWRRGPTFGGHFAAHYLPPEVFDALDTTGSLEDDGWRNAGGVVTMRAYASRAAAYLALAAALETIVARAEG